ncbi:MAG: LuxR C-terminal-related transcriptional regulator, partial [Actinomycetes bacterium]
VAIVRHPTVVESYRTAFERLWSMATLFPADDLSGRELIRDQLHIGILQHLAAGEKDEVIARRLGLSVRTCRRYIAAIMDGLGANGRFQAGMLAQRLVFDELATERRDRPPAGAGSRPPR